MLVGVCKTLGFLEKYIWKTLYLYRLITELQSLLSICAVWISERENSFSVELLLKSVLESSDWHFLYQIILFG